VAIDDVVSLRLYTDAGGGGWQAGYRGHYARAPTREGAVAGLRRHLAAAGIAFPPGNASGSVRVAITGAKPEVAVAAESLPYVAFAGDESQAVEALRDLCRLAGEPCPEHVYDVAKAIAAWMN
jgi:hypothetical protein